MTTCVYEAVPGFFIQDDPNTDLASIGALPPRFGLLDDSPQRWKTFQSQIDQLNGNAANNTSYKVFFFGRHGQGTHNVAEAKYGTKAWDDYFSTLNGDDQLTWGPDPDLTELGKSQARAASKLWQIESAAGIPIPQKAYCSPLTRAMRTNVITFGGIITDANTTTTIVENCREENGIHTCDKRSTRTYIRAEFPQFEIEAGFTEEDELWKLSERETIPEIIGRAKLVLDAIFQNDPQTYISITGHGGIINAYLAVIGRPRYILPVGGVLAVVVKGTSVE